MLKIRTMAEAEVSEIANGTLFGVQEGDTVLVAQCSHMPAPLHFPFPSPAHMLHDITEALRAAGAPTPPIAPPTDPPRPDADDGDGAAAAVSPGLPVRRGVLDATWRGAHPLHRPGLPLLRGLPRPLLTELGDSGQERLYPLLAFAHAPTAKERTLHAHSDTNAVLDAQEPAGREIAVAEIDVSDLGVIDATEVREISDRPIIADVETTLPDRRRLVEVNVANGVAHVGDPCLWKHQRATVLDFLWQEKSTRWDVLIRFENEAASPRERKVVASAVSLLLDEMGDAPPARPMPAADDTASAQRLPGMPETEMPRPSRFARDAWGTPADAERKARTVFPIPQDAEFDEEGAIEDNRLWSLAQDLIKANVLFDSLASLRISYFWKRHGGSIDGAVKKVDDFTSVKTDGDQLNIWLAADSLRKRAATELEVEMLMFDLLYSIDASKPGTNRPEYELNIGTLLRYGFCTPELRMLRNVLLELLPVVDGQVMSAASTAVGR